MDRLTNVNESMPLLESENFVYWRNVYNRLAAYENAGLLPEEVEVLFHRSKRDDVVIPDVTFFGKPLEHWDEIDKAEIEGRLIVLPCKVGDTVYAIRDERVYETPVIGFRAHEWEEGFRVVLLFDSRKTNGAYEYPIAYFGEVVFLTREEAERALKAN